MHPWIANTKANTNILPQIVFENLRKTMKNLSKRKIDTVHRSKSGDNEEIYESVSEFMDDLNDYQIEKNDEIMEEDERGRRAISYAEDLNDMHFFHFKKMGKKYLSNLALKVKDFKEEEKKQL